MYGLPAVPEEIERYIQAASAEPAMEESAMFDAVVDVVMKGDYDYYIYDLVPLGHALYYLSMAKVYDEWINKITKLRQEMREYEEMVSRLRREKESEQDQILQELLYIKNRINTSAGIFTDKAKTAFFFVVIPEAGVINDTQKAARLFAQFDVPVAGYVVNRVIPHALLDQNIPEYLRRRIAMQDQHMGEMRESLGQPGVGAGAGDGSRRHGASDDREARRHHVRLAEARHGRDHNADGPLPPRPAHAEVLLLRRQGRCRQDRLRRRCRHRARPAGTPNVAGVHQSRAQPDESVRPGYAW